MNNFLSFSTKGNSRRKVLTEEVMKQEHNLLCYSKNLAMTDYKEGYSSEWSNSKEKVQLFTQLLKEQPDENGISYYLYVSIDGVAEVDYKLTFNIKDSLSNASSKLGMLV